MNKAIWPSTITAYIEMSWRDRSLAKRRAGKTCDVTGRRATDDALYSMLEEIGVRVTRP
jgi:hypothetical protein